MALDLKELKKTVKFMRDQGILSLKLPDFEINLSPSSIFPEKPRSKSEESEIKEDFAPRYTEEQILNWSVPGFVDEQVTPNA